MSASKCLACIKELYCYFLDKAEKVQVKFEASNYVVLLQFPRVDFTTNPAIEFRAIGINIQEFQGDDHIRAPMFGFHMQLKCYFLYKSKKAQVKFEISNNP